MGDTLNFTGPIPHPKRRAHTKRDVMHLKPQITRADVIESVKHIQDELEALYKAHRQHPELFDRSVRTIILAQLCSTAALSTSLEGTSHAAN